MPTINKLAITLIITTVMMNPVYSYSIRNHLINMGKNLGEAVGSPFYGTFFKGPKNIKKAYIYEVWEKEKPEKINLFRYKLFALWRAPGEETKGIIDGLVNSVQASGNCLKELISIFFSD